MTIEQEEFDLQQAKEKLNNIDYLYPYADPEYKEMVRKAAQRRVDVLQLRVNRKKNIALTTELQNEAMYDEAKAKKLEKRADNYLSPSSSFEAITNAAANTVGAGADLASNLFVGLPSYLTRAAGRLTDSKTVEKLGEWGMGLNRRIKDRKRDVALDLASGNLSGAYNSFVNDDRQYIPEEDSSYFEGVGGNKWDSIGNAAENIAGGVGRFTEGYMEFAPLSVGLGAVSSGIGKIGSGLNASNKAIKAANVATNLGIFAGSNVADTSDYIEQQSGEFRPGKAALSSGYSAIAMELAFAIGRGMGMNDTEAYNYATRMLTENGFAMLGKKALKQGLTTAALNGVFHGGVGSGLRELVSFKDPSNPTEEEINRLVEKAWDGFKHEFVQGGFFGTLGAVNYHRDVSKMFDELGGKSRKTIKVIENGKMVDKEVSAFKHNASAQIIRKTADETMSKEAFNNLFKTGTYEDIKSYLDSISENISPKLNIKDSAEMQAAKDIYDFSVWYQWGNSKIGQMEQLQKNRIKSINVANPLDVQIVLSPMKQRLYDMKTRFEYLNHLSEELDKTIESKNSTFKQKQEAAQQKEEVLVKKAEVRREVETPYTRAEVIEAVRDMVARGYGNNPELLNKATERLADFLSKYNSQEPIGVDDAIRLLNEVESELNKLNPDVKFDNYNSDIENIINPKLIGSDVIYGRDERNIPTSVIPTDYAEPRQIGYDGIIYGNDERNMPTSALSNNTQPQSVLPSPQETPLLEYNPTGRRQMPISEGSNQPINNMDVGSKVNRESPSSFGVVNDVPRSVNMLEKPNKSNMSEKPTGSADNIKSSTIRGKKLESPSVSMGKSQKSEDLSINGVAVKKGELKDRDMPMAVSQPSSEPMAVKKESTEKSSVAQKTPAENKNIEAKYAKFVNLVNEFKKNKNEELSKQEIIKLAKEAGLTKAEFIDLVNKSKEIQNNKPYAESMEDWENWKPSENVRQFVLNYGNTKEKPTDSKKPTTKKSSKLSKEAQKQYDFVKDLNPWEFEESDEGEINLKTIDDFKKTLEKENLPKAEKDKILAEVNDLRERTEKRVNKLKADEAELAKKIEESKSKPGTTEEQWNDIKSKILKSVFSDSEEASVDEIRNRWKKLGRTDEEIDVAFEIAENAGINMMSETDKLDETILRYKKAKKSGNQKAVDKYVKKIQKELDSVDKIYREDLKSATLADEINDAVSKDLASDNIKENENLNNLRQNLIYEYMKADVESVEKESATNIPKQQKVIEAPTAKKSSAVENIVRGKKTKMTTKANGGMEVDGEFAVVDVNKLKTATDIGKTQNRNRKTVASQAQVNSIANNPNPEYLIVDNPDSANGAMVVLSDGTVLSGNGRTLGLSEAYKYGNADKYKAYLKEHAPEFGIDPREIDKIENPVLVRIVDSKNGFDVKRFVKESNESRQLGRNAAETARTDAENIKGILREFNNIDDIASPSNKEFIQKFFEKTVGDTERANYLAEDGSLTQDGQRRIENALIASLYGDNPRLIEKLANTTNTGIKNIAKALIATAKDGAKLKGEVDKGMYFDVDLNKEISDAALTYVDTVAEMHRQGVNGSPINFYLANMKDRLTPEGKLVFGMLSELNNKPKQVREFLQIINDVIRGHGDPQQGDLFAGKNPKPNKLQIIKEALQAFDSRYGTDFSKQDLSKWNKSERTLFDIGNEVREDGTPASVKKFVPDYKSKKKSSWTKEDWENYDNDQIKIAYDILGEENTDTTPIEKTNDIKLSKQQQNMYKSLKEFLPDIFEVYDREAESPAPVQALMNILRGGESLADIETAITRGDPREAIDIIKNIKQRVELTYSKDFSNRIAKNCDRLIKMIKNSNYRSNAIKPISLEELEAQPINRMPQEDVESWREGRELYVADKRETEPSKQSKREYADIARNVAELYREGKITKEQRKYFYDNLKPEYDFNLDVNLKKLEDYQKEIVSREREKLRSSEAFLVQSLNKGLISFNDFVERRRKLSIDYHDSLWKSGILTNGIRRQIVDPNRYKPQLSRTKDKATNPVTDKELNNFLRGQAKQITKETGLNFKVVDSVDELRKMFPNNDITDTVEGGIHKDTVYLVRGNIDRDRLPLVIAHEVAGHRGVESLFENKQQMDNFFNSLERAAVKDKFIRDAFAEVDRLGYKENRSREAMAKIVEKVRNESGTLKGTAKTFVNFITSRVRRLLRRMGFKNLQLNEAEVYDIAVQALRRTGLKNSNKFFGLDRFLAKDNSFLSATSTELDKKYPNWLKDQEKASGAHSTQIEQTKETYKKIGEFMKQNGMGNKKILDASSGMGYGTEELRKMGFDIEDVEPYPGDDREFKPTYGKDYKDYKEIYRKHGKTYDVIISNAVLNVIPDDWRREQLHAMADVLLKDGGKIFLNVRDTKEIENQTQKIELDSPREILVTNAKGDKITAYQRGFDQAELEYWLTKELGRGYTVEAVKESNSGLNKGTRAVVITKNSANANKTAKQVRDDITKRLTPDQLANREFNNSAQPMSGLKTLKSKKNTLGRYKGIVGKDIGDQLYVHKNYADEVIPVDKLNKARQILSQTNPDFKYKTIMWDKKKGTIRFDEAPNFDTAPEPIPGVMITVDPETGNIRKGYSQNIWHHKWQWVKDDYKGFDTRKSWERSREWLNGLADLELDKEDPYFGVANKGVANGRQLGYGGWNDQLYYYGLDHMIDDTNNTVPLDSYKEGLRVIAEQKAIDKALKANMPKEAKPKKSSKSKKADIQFSIGERKPRKVKPDVVSEAEKKILDEIGDVKNPRDYNAVKKIAKNRMAEYKDVFSTKKNTGYKTSALKLHYLLGFDRKTQSVEKAFQSIRDFNTLQKTASAYARSIIGDKSTQASILDSIVKAKSFEKVYDIISKTNIAKEREIRKDLLDDFRNTIKELNPKKISTPTRMYTDEILGESFTPEELDSLINSNEFTTKAVGKLRNIADNLASELGNIRKSDIEVSEYAINNAARLKHELNEIIKQRDAGNGAMNVPVEKLAEVNQLLKRFVNQDKLYKESLDTSAKNAAVADREQILSESPEKNPKTVNSRETNSIGRFKEYILPGKALKTQDNENVAATMGKTMHKVAYENLLEGQNRQDHYRATGYKGVDRIMESFGKDLEDGREYLDKTAFKVKTSEGHEYEITNNEALAIIANYLDRETGQMIKKAGKVNFYLGEKKDSDYFTFTRKELDDMVNKLTPKQKKAIEDGFALLSNDFLPELNRVYEKLNGVPLRLIQGRYFPRMHVDITQSGSNGLITRDRAPYIHQQMNADYQGILKQRDAMATPNLNLRGFTDTLQNYTDQASLYIGMAEPLRHLNRIMNGQMKRELTARYGAEYVNRINQMTRLMAGMAGKTEVDKGFATRYLSNLAAAKLTPLSAIKQLTSVPLASSVIPAEYLAKASISGMSNENIKEMMELDGMILRYRSNGIAGIIPVNAKTWGRERIQGEKFKGQKLIDKAVGVGLNLSLMADKRALGIIYKATKLWAESQGKGSDKAWIENKFMEAVRRTQNTTDLASATGWQMDSRESGTMAFLNMYLNQTQKVSNEFFRNKRLMDEAAKKYGKDSAQYKEARNRTATFAASAALMEAMMLAIGSGASMLFKGKDEDSVKDKAITAVSDLTGNPLLKPMINAYSLQGVLKGKKPTNAAVFGDDFSGMIPEITYTMGRVMNDLQSDDPAARKFRKLSYDMLSSKAAETSLALGRVPTWFARYPAKFIKRIWGEDLKNTRQKPSTSSSGGSSRLFSGKRTFGNSRTFGGKRMF